MRTIILNVSSGAARNESGFHLGRVRPLPDGWLHWDHHGHDIKANGWQAMKLELSITYSAQVQLER